VATNVSRQLMRSAQRGTMPTRSMPMGGPPSGVFEESDGPADGQLSALQKTPTAADADAAFAEIFGSMGGSVSTAESISSPSPSGGDAFGEALAAQIDPDQVFHPSIQHAAPVAADPSRRQSPAALAQAQPDSARMGPASLPPQGSATLNRSQRFKGAGLNVGAASVASENSSAAKPTADVQQPRRSAVSGPEQRTSASEVSQSAVTPKSVEQNVPSSVEVATPRSVPRSQMGAGVMAKGSGVTKVLEPGSALLNTSVRQNMAAAKVITPLVAAISFAPGSGQTPEAKSRALTEMLVGVHRTAVQTAEAISSVLGEDVPSWMVTQLMQALSGAVASRWEAGQGADLKGLAQAMGGLFEQNGQEVAALIRGASEDAYVEVNHPEISRFRLSVTAANAGWVIYDWITHKQLSIDPKGEMPSRFFTYGRSVQELVNKVLVQVVDQCRGLVAQVESPDLRTAHMQSSINRMSNLVGSEYVTRTRQIMNWIAEDGISDAEYESRMEQAAAQFDTTILPEIFEYARTNFIFIEQGAFRAIEELYENTKSPVPGAGGTSRPAHS
jgi:hypothetical protein